MGSCGFEGFSSRLKLIVNFVTTSIFQPHVSYLMPAVLVICVSFLKSARYQVSSHHLCYKTLSWTLHWFLFYMHKTHTHTHMSLLGPKKFCQEVQRVKGGGMHPLTNTNSEVILYLPPFPKLLRNLHQFKLILHIKVSWYTHTQKRSRELKRQQYINQIISHPIIYQKKQKIQKQKKGVGDYLLMRWKPRLGTMQYVLSRTSPQTPQT